MTREHVFTLSSCLRLESRGHSLVPMPGGSYSSSDGHSAWEAQSMAGSQRSEGTMIGDLKAFFKRWSKSKWSYR